MPLVTTIFGDFFALSVYLLALSDDFALSGYAIHFLKNLELLTTLFFYSTASSPPKIYEGETSLKYFFIGCQKFLLPGVFGISKFGQFKFLNFFKIAISCI